MSPTAERVNQVARLFVPLAAGVLLIVVGVIRGNLAMIALGGGALGIPGLTTVTTGKGGTGAQS